MINEAVITRAILQTRPINCHDGATRTHKGDVSLHSIFERSPFMVGPWHESRPYRVAAPFHRERAYRASVGDMARVTLRDVAAVAGVSVATVSKVVTGRYGNASIPPGTVERVRAVLAELKYVPNALGRGLQARQTGQIGVVLRPFPTVGHTPQLLALDGALLIGLSDAAAEHQLPGFVLHVLGKDEVPLSTRYLDGRTDGLLVRSALLSDDPFLNSLNPAVLPLVTLWRQNERDGAGYADVDHRGGAREACHTFACSGSSPDRHVWLGRRPCPFSAALPGLL